MTFFIEAGGVFHAIQYVTHITSNGAGGSIVHVDQGARPGDGPFELPQHSPGSLVMALQSGSTSLPPPDVV